MKAKTFEEIIVDRINVAIEDKDFAIANMEEKELKKDACERIALLSFVQNIYDVMQLDVDDAAFRQIVGSFFTYMVNEVMNNE